MSSLKTVLTAVVSGDARALDTLIGVPQDHLLDGARDMELVLTNESLARVLLDLESHEIGGTDAQRWASFIRRGYVEGQTHSPIRPIDIGYQTAFEDEIVEIIARLDEIGDVIDGDVPSRSEISDYLVLLGLGGR